MSSNRTWTLKLVDGSVQEFMDIRRKVGNRIIRAYLLDPVVAEKRIERITGSLRGPKNEFQDLAKFLILRTTVNSHVHRFLAETGVYENIRIVGTDSDTIMGLDPDEIINTFTDALMKAAHFETTLVLSSDSKMGSEEKDV